MFDKCRGAAFALFVLGLTVGPTAAAPGHIEPDALQGLPIGGRLTDGSFVVPPRAFGTFCETYLDQCASVGGVGVVHLDADRWAELQRVNFAVNRHIRRQSDAPGTDVWTIGADAGDCDDYAVEKRRELIDRGWPSSSLNLAVAYLPDGEAHLLVTVRTDRGDFALDNLRRQVVSVDRVGYRWVARQSAIHPRLWVRVDGVSRDDVPVAEASTPSTPVEAVLPKPARAFDPSIEPIAVIASAAVPSPIRRDADEIGAVSTISSTSVLARYLDPLAARIPAPGARFVW